MERMRIGNFLNPRYDVVAKTLLGSEKYKELCIKFLKATLQLPPEEYNTLEFCNPYLYPEYNIDDGKICIVNVLIKTTSRVKINIEMQRSTDRYMHERALLYTSKIFSEQLEKSHDYRKIQKVINITIMDYGLNEEKNMYHFEKAVTDTYNHKKEPRGIEMHFLELPKLKNNYDGTALWDILSFFNVRSEEEMAKLAQNENTEAYVKALRELSSDERIVAILNAENKIINDRVTSEAIAAEKVRVEVAKNALAMGILTNAQISVMTGLSIEEIKKLNVD